MSQTITISDTLYVRLEGIARDHGFQNIEQLLESWQIGDTEWQNRQRIVQQIDQLRDQMFNKYGEMQDSVEILHDDRSRT